MKKFNEVREMSGEELLEVIKSNDRATMCVVLGTFIGSKVKVEELEAKAKQYVKACGIWQKNWQSVIEALAPELEEAHQAQADKVEADFAELSPEQQKNILAKYGYVA